MQKMMLDVMTREEVLEQLGKRANIYSYLVKRDRSSGISNQIV